MSQRFARWLQYSAYASAILLFLYEAGNSIVQGAYWLAQLATESPRVQSGLTALFGILIGAALGYVLMKLSRRIVAVERAALRLEARQAMRRTTPTPWQRLSQRPSVRLAGSPSRERRELSGIITAIISTQAATVLLLGTEIPGFTDKFQELLGAALENSPKNV